MTAAKPAPTETPAMVQTPARPEASGDGAPPENEVPEPKARRRIRRLIRGLLIAWWTLIGFVGLALLGNILVVPLAQTPGNWWDGVLTQIANLTAIAQTYPLQTGAAVLVVLLLTLLSFAENRALQREQEIAAQQPIIELEERVSKVEQRQAGVPLPPNVVAPTSLPLADFVGREQELRDLKARLGRGEAVGVFALEGIGGVGKTALAAQATSELSEDTAAFPGGAIWIACEGRAGETGLSEVWTLVADAIQLDVSQLPDANARRVAVASALAQAPRRLIALDNVEPGLDAVAIIDSLSIPGHTALLLTARQAVAPDKVTKIELEPLPEPDAETLFSRRLTQADKTRPSEDERGAIPTLVAAMGGLPLAIELTAAYAGVTHLTLAKVVEEVDEDGLSAAALNPQDPQNAKRALVVRFDRSWRVLSARQRRLFAGLSLLARASFPRDAALALGEAAEEGESADPSGDVAALVGYALVEALPGGERLRLHPLLREYAASKLNDLAEVSAVQAAWLGDAMQAYWLAYAQAHPGYAGMDALEAEADGLMGALEWVHEKGRHRDVLALAGALNRFWFVRGRIDEARLARPWALEAAKASHNLAAEFWTTHEMAVLNSKTGQLDEARAGFERALKLAQELHDPSAERAEVHEMAVLNAQTGQLDEARAGYERALKLAQELHDPSAERAEVHALAVLNAQTGQLDEARAGFERALKLAQELHDPSAEQAEVHALAVLNSKTGQLDEARAGYERALKLAQELHDPSAERAEVHALAVLNSKTGQLDEARAGFERALKLAQELHDPSAERAEVHEMAVLNAQTGQLDEARAGYERALKLAQELHDPSAERAEVHALAVLNAQTGQLDEARAGFERALKLAQELHDPSAEQAEVHALAVLNSKTGQLDEARAGYERALKLAQELHDPSAERAEVHALAVLNSKTGQLDEARAGFERALKLAQELHDPSAEQAEVHALAVLNAQTGQLDEARAGFERALKLAQELHDPSAEQAEVHEMAVLNSKTGQLDEARAGYERALELARKMRDPSAEAVELISLGDTIRYLGELDMARQYILQGLVTSERLGDPYMVAKSYELLARLDEQEDKRSDAIMHYQEALRRLEQLRSPEAAEVRHSLRKLTGEE